jgi:hypothetical protein
MTDWIEPHKRRRHDERDRQKAIVEYLLLRGAVLAVTDAGVAKKLGYNRTVGVPNGWPDIVACWRGRFVGIEVKSEHGRQKPHQRVMQERIEKAGGMYVLARCVDDVIKALSSGGYGCSRGPGR